MSGTFRKTISFGIVALFLVFSAVMLAFVLPSGGWKALSIQTGSMEPELSPGDLVLVQRIPANQYHVGDVITFVNPREETQTVTHRIVEKADGPQRSVFVTKGDANTINDSPINDNRVVGKVVQTVPYAGYAVDFIRTIPGLIVIIYLPALLIIIHELRKLTAYYRKQAPYVLTGYDPRHSVKGQKLATAAVTTGALFAISAGIAIPVNAAMKTQASLTGNTISIAATPPKNNCNVSNNTSVSISSTTNQSATTGNASSSNNTTGGSAISGNASNSSSSSININVNNSGGCPVQP